jgi:hypothetical protein
MAGCSCWYMTSLRIFCLNQAAYFLSSLANNIPLVLRNKITEPHVCARLVCHRLVTSPTQQIQGGLVSLWLYKGNDKLRDWKNIFTHSPLSSSHLWFRCSNLFDPSKKNSFGCAANRNCQRLISSPTYIHALPRLCMQHWDVESMHFSVLVPSSLSAHITDFRTLHSVNRNFIRSLNRAGIRFPTASIFFLLRSVQTGSTVNPASYPMGTGGSFPGG